MYMLTAPNTPIPISVNKSPFWKVSDKLSHGWRRLPLFMDDLPSKGAGIGCKLKMVIYVYTELGVAGVPRGGAAVRRPLGVVATAT